MCRLTPSDLLFLYDGTLEGFFSTVFEAYARHVRPESIQVLGNAQPMLLQEVVEVQCDLSKAERVKVGLCNKVGYGAYDNLKMAFLSCVEGREISLFDYIVLAMEQGRRALNDPSNPTVAAVDRLALRVSHEREYMYQFVRFEQLENGVFFATINPSANVLPLLMNHFVSRFNTQPFVIYDEVHHVAGLYDCKGQCLVQTDELTVPDRAQGEKEFQFLWKTFYDCVSNEQRYNPDLRRSHMPQRFWRNLTEMKLACA